MALSREQLEVNIEKARRAGYSDQQIQAALAGVQLQGSTPTRPRREGFLADVARSFVRPFQDYGALAVEAGAQAGNRLNPELRAISKNIDEGTASEQDLYRYETAFKPQAMTTPKQKFAFDEMTDPNKTALQRVGSGLGYGARKSAGVASYFVPVGGQAIPGLAGTAGGRILGSGLSGFAAGALRTAGEDFTDAKDILKGGAAGGVTSGLLTGTGEAFRAGVPKIGEFVKNRSKDLALKTLKPNATQQRKYAERFGTSIQDDLVDFNLAGGSYDDIVNASSALQQQYDDLTINSTKKIAKKQILDSYDEAIAELSDKVSQQDPAKRKVVEFLKKEKDLFAATADDWTLPEITEIRRSIDSNTPNRQFDFMNWGKSRAHGNVYRKVISDTAGTKDLGKELSKLYYLQDVAWKNQFIGTSRKPINWGQFIPFGVGSMAAGGNLSGGLVALGITKVVNNPKVMSKATKLGLGLGNNLASRGGGFVANPNAITLRSDATLRNLTGAFSSGIPARFAAGSVQGNQLDLSGGGNQRNALINQVMSGDLTPAQAATMMGGGPYTQDNQITNQQVMSGQLPPSSLEIYPNPQDSGGFTQGAAGRTASIVNAMAALGGGSTSSEEQLAKNRALQFKQDMLGVALELKNAGTDRIAGGSGLLMEGLTLGNRIPSKYGDTKAKYEQLKSMLSLENRQMLKGSGTISDFEAKMLGDAATALRPNMTDEAFARELNKVISILGRGIVDGY